VINYAVSKCGKEVDIIEKNNVLYITVYIYSVPGFFYGVDVGFGADKI
jgi:hypothetical protein